MTAMIVLAATDAASLGFAIDLMVIFASAALVAALFQRFRLESIPGFLIAGVLVGPHVLGLVQDSPRIEQISGLAVILLMFGIGLHLDVGSIRRGMVHFLGIGIVSTLAFVVLAWIGLRVVGVSGPVALLLAMAASISSTAVFVRVVSSRKEMRAVHGRTGLGVSIAQDVLSVAILALVPVVARGATGTVEGTTDGSTLPGWLEFLAAAGKGLGGVMVMLAVGRFVLPRLLHLVAKAGSGELMLVVSASVALVAAVGTKVLGFSPEMGAFLAGLLLASTPYRYQLSGLLSPLRDLLMAIFFTAVGLAVDPTLMLDHFWVVMGGVAAVMIVKTGLISVTAWAGGVSAPSALLTGVYLGNAGEFTIVILGAAAAAGGVSAGEQSLGVTVVILSLIATSFVIGPSHAVAALLKRVPICGLFSGEGLNAPVPTIVTDHSAVSGHVIIAGFGPVGRSLADRFDLLGMSYVVVELNSKTVERQAARGRRVVYGDVTNPEVLESAGIHRADAVILTFPDDEVMLRACAAVRALAPSAFVAARANFLSASFRAQQMGADHVTVEEIATAQAMEREVLAKLVKRSAKIEAMAAEEMSESGNAIETLDPQSLGITEVSPEGDRPDKKSREFTP